MGFHRGRIRLDKSGDISQYLDQVPAGSICLGVVQVGTAAPGALIYVESTREYWQLDLSGRTKLVTRKVQAALDALGDDSQSQQTSGSQAK